MAKIKGLRTKIPPTFKERLSDILFKLNLQKEKLEQITERLCQRDNEIIQRCIGAYMTGDEDHAKIYANECAEVRNMFKIAKGVQLALEKVIIRLETVEQFGDVLTHIAPVMGVVREIKKEISGLIPEVAGELEKVTSILADLSAETGQVPTSDFEVQVASEEARRVLEESKSVADQRVREQFPELPFQEYLGSDVEAKKVEHGDRLEEPLLEQVLSYIETHQGRVSITECAQTLSRSPSDVIKAIGQLKEEGRVIVE
ncbi:MAG: Snf7 family protein [Candidatus Bathyarchaeia archaeon]